MLLIALASNAAVVFRVTAPGARMSVICLDMRSGGLRLKHLAVHYHEVLLSLADWIGGDHDSAAAPHAIDIRTVPQVVVHLLVCSPGIVAVLGVVSLAVLPTSDAIAFT